MPVDQIPEPAGTLANSGSAVWIYLGGVITTAVATIYGIFKTPSPFKEETKVVSTVIEMVDTRQLMEALKKVIELSTESNAKIDAISQRLRDEEIDRKARAEERAKISSEQTARERARER